METQLCGFATESNGKKLRQRFDIILNDSATEKNKKLATLVYLFIIIFFFATHSFDLQLAWNPSQDEDYKHFSLDNNFSNAYFVYIDDSSYELFVEDESYGIVFAEDVNKPPFDKVEKRYPEK